MAFPSWKPQAPGSYFVLPNPGNYAVRLRAHARFRQTWSEWSAVRRFGLGSFQEEKLRAQTRAEGRPECDLGKDTHFRDWLTCALIPLGALLALGLGVALCRR
ncbi:uncharacterized protein LOC121024608 isoform X1 [Herpailurus yagouaroundi]|uniref:uncharacterized protein LOC121024608 isoform X1 n=1 Tax=Herpailurus yagouaroundi TaxID=1608482 RepID=UPI001AD6CE17|nr:uncharacterized protein LOC121024608 isoform X1 [Puma yagouaroundi]